MDINAVSILGALAIVAAWAFGVFRENSDEVLKRAPYIMACIGAFALMVAAGLVAGFMGMSEQAIILATTAVQIVVGYVIAGKSTQRARDAGWPKTWVYCMIIPIVGFIIMLVLWFKGSAHSGTPQADPS